MQHGNADSKLLTNGTIDRSLEVPVPTRENCCTKKPNCELILCDGNMAAGQISVYDKQPSYVCCATCKHFRRDTEGRSRSQATGEYFMGVCELGLHPDSIRKQFANKPRLCKNHDKTSVL